MKWRPISELSDEQRDGRWVLFARETYDIESEGYQPNAKHICEYRFSNGLWVDECESGWSNDPKSIPDCGEYFLSEPLPDLPKPQKMERHPEVCVCEGDHLCNYGSEIYHLLRAGRLSSRRRMNENRNQ